MHREAARAPAPRVAEAQHGEATRLEGAGAAQGRGEGRAQGGDGLEDLLDQIAAEVETQIYTAGEALDLLLMDIGAPTTEIDLPEPPEGVAARTGVIRMLFPVTYRSLVSDPTTKA